jgi:hypothetical protein
VLYLLLCVLTCGGRGDVFWLPSLWLTVTCLAVSAVLVGEC